MNALDQYPSGLAAPRAERRGGSTAVLGGAGGSETDWVGKGMVGVLCAGGLGKSEWNNLVGVIFAVRRVSLDMGEGE